MLNNVSVCTTIQQDILQFSPTFYHRVCTAFFHIPKKYLLHFYETYKNAHTSKHFTKSLPPKGDHYNT
uniref:Uncharacterized protein n=1 Tax=Anguilla anguilla TaxID=7936 RepID=A0A0E9SM75_ANGAN